MTNINVIIGNNYGDEGKGLLSRYYCLNAKGNAIVVFFNGSAQRGHTVELKDGTRHVFHHFGAGTFDNVPTFFAETFMIHPMTFEKEYMELYPNYKPITFTDPNSFVITPIDMVIDQITEDWIAERRSREYGSCGYGTWSGTDRQPSIYFSAKDFYENDVKTLLTYIFNNWFWPCLHNRGINELPSIWRKYADLDGWVEVFERFEKTINFMKVLSPLCDFKAIYNSYSDLIFEGAQGLMLDKDFAPNKGWNTTSHTGLDNPAFLLRSYTNYNLTACYVSRTYITRHGDGPFKEISKAELSADIGVDETNGFNEFQGNFKYGKDIKESFSKQLIAQDALKIPNTRIVRALTHCDEFEKIKPDFDLFSYSKYAEDIIIK